MNPSEDQSELRDLFARQAAGVPVPEPRLTEITNHDAATPPTRARDASRVVLVAAAAAMVVTGLVGIGMWRSADAPDLSPNGNSLDLTDTTAHPDVVQAPADSAAVTTSEPTFPQADPNAENFLITGTDNNACVDPDSPYAPAFGDRSNMGERSDTIMMWRVDPTTSQVTVLSFPRDLWVTIDDRPGQQRINAAYERDNPQKLINTIYNNFGITTDHFIQVDFCAFKTLVDAVDGVTVPFATPVRDSTTGLNVPAAGCFTFDGDHALAYVRSRHLESYTPDGGWVADPTSDLGRISRQQDFMRRTITQLLDQGAFDPSVAAALVETLSNYIVTDPGLTPRKMLELAGVLKNIDPTDITTYQIETSETTIQGNSILIPELDSTNMQAILAIFQGRATLADAPDVNDHPTQDTTEPTVTIEPTNPTVVAEEHIFGVVPDPTAVCPPSPNRPD